MKTFLTLMKISFLSIDEWMLLTLYYNRIDLMEGIHSAQSNKNKKRIFCDYSFFNQGFKFKKFVNKVCHDLMMFCVNLGNNAIITVKGDNYCCIIYEISKSEAINLLEILYLMIVGIYEIHIKNIKIDIRVHNCYFENFTKTKKLEIKYILIDGKNFKNLVFYFIRYFHSKLIKATNYVKTILVSLKELSGIKFEKLKEKH